MLTLGILDNTKRSQKSGGEIKSKLNWNENREHHLAFALLAERYCIYLLFMFSIVICYKQILYIYFSDAWTMYKNSHKSVSIDAHQPYNYYKQKFVLFTICKHSLIRLHSQLTHFMFIRFVFASIFSVRGNYCLYFWMEIINAQAHTNL